MAIECKHGHLARVCLTCELEQEIAQLTRERDEAVSGARIVNDVLSGIESELASLRADLVWIARANWVMYAPGKRHPNHTAFSNNDDSEKYGRAYGYIEGDCYEGHEDKLLAAVRSARLGNGE